MEQSTQPKGSKANNLSIVAWVTFAVLTGSGHGVAGALGALLIAAAIVAREYSRDAVKLMDCVTVAYFVIALITTIVIGPWLFRNLNVSLSWGTFALVTWVALLAGFPFTIQYAREKAPPEIWDHPLFIRLNVILTVVFGLMFSVNTIFGVMALRTGDLLLLGLVVPLSLLVGAIVFSMVYPKRYFERVAPGWAAAQAAEAGRND